jgi:hypothetical protein
MFSFYLYYLVYYLLGAVALVALIVTGYWYAAPSVLLWCAWLGLVAWLLLYHVVVLRMHYRSLRRTLAQLSSYARGGARPSAEEAADLAMRLGGDSLGMPEFLARYLIKKFYRP